MVSRRLGIVFGMSGSDIGSCRSITDHSTRYRCDSFLDQRPDSQVEHGRLSGQISGG